MKKSRWYRQLPMLGGWSVLVAEDIEVELELRLVAAMVSYQGGLKSMDRLLRFYGERWRKRLEEIRKVHPTE